MPESDRKHDWLDSEDNEPGPVGLPRPELNPLVNPLLGQNMGRWAQVYFTSPPDQREQAVEKLVQELQAEAGEKKPATSEVVLRRERDVHPAPRIVEAERIDSVPESKEVNVPTPPVPVRELEVVLCPACQHKNAVEQRFCGICGTGLVSEPEVPVERQARLPDRAISASPAETAEPDWQWLRQRRVADFESVQEKRSIRGVLIGAVVLLLLVTGAYFIWRGTNRAQPEQVSPTSGRSDTNQPPSGRSPASAIPGETKSSEPQPPKATKPSSHKGEPVATSLSSADTSSSEDDGRDDLDQGRRYLNGEGVPRNSWMASQYLWKAVAKQNSDAVLLLSDLYAHGDGVPRSCEQARVLLIAAAKKGSSAAAQKLRSVENTCR